MNTLQKKIVIGSGSLVYIATTVFLFIDGNEKTKKIAIGMGLVGAVAVLVGVFVLAGKETDKE